MNHKLFHRTALLALGLALSVGETARADHRLVPVRDALPLPADARSFVIHDNVGITIMTSPAGDAPIAGRTLPDASFAPLEARIGPGCRRLWVRIGADAWICGEHGSLSVLPPDPVDHVAPRDDDGLPWPYAFTARDHTRAYHSLEAAASASSDPNDFDEWEANWGFATAETLGAGNARIVRTQHGAYLRRGDLYRASPTGFAGGAFWELAGDAPGVPFGWVAVGGTQAYPQPEESGRATPVHRLSRVHVFALQRGRDGRPWARIAPEQWVPAEHVRWITPEPPPGEVNVAARERWIDIDLTSQTLVAYEGPDPVYATMVSTGDRYPTQPGVFRIWGRFLAHTMDNTESAHLANHFRLGDVPYVQFFDHDRALHAVYWHDEFGVPRSHGCVNLSPRDAAFLFRFTQPPLPRGWMSQQIAAGAGTVIRVRGRYVAARTE